MNKKLSFTSVRFSKYKAFRNFSVRLQRFNVLVGPNNSGKSTILGAFRILSEGIRRARARRPTPIHISGEASEGYLVDLTDLPVSIENVFTDYDDSEPATVTFRINNGSTLRLIFPEVGLCIMTCGSELGTIRSPSDFRKYYPVTIGLVPVLGPVEHNEQLYQQEAARRALFTHGASRNFRNIWYHYKEDFPEFRKLVRQTWPDMDIERPTTEYMDRKTCLYMMCLEKRYPREMYWAGFGFQVWCQILTYALRAKEDTVLIIDEADIYLHADLQRQLVSILKDLGPDILLATHSVDIISEAESGELLVIQKHAQSAKRISSPAQLQDVFQILGSNLNPTLTQLARTRRALFVEGNDDFRILGILARICGYNALANRSGLAVIPVEGFNPRKIKDFGQGVENALGCSIVKAVIFDRDYRSETEVSRVEKELLKVASFAHMLQRKEIENYLLDPSVLERATNRRLEERAIHTGKVPSELSVTFAELLETETEKMKNDVIGHYISARIEELKISDPGLDSSTMNKTAVSEFDELWKTLDGRLQIVPGKAMLKNVNIRLQGEIGISISPFTIASCMSRNYVSDEIQAMLKELNNFSQINIDDENK